MKKLEFELNGQFVSGYAMPVGDQLWVHYDGSTFCVSNQSESNQKRNSRKSNAKTGQITAPMPGKVTKVLVKVGDIVAENQSVIVMEAMKMEYSLKSQISGHIKEIFCAVDSQVTLGTTLALVEPTASPNAEKAK